MTDHLLDILKARRGVVCCVGAGGKKTTMYRLAEAYPGRVGLTTTAHIEYFPRTLDASCYVGDEAVLLETVRNDRDSRIIAFATPSERTGRHAGISLDNVNVFREAGRFELLLIKSDGARSRLIKAPNDNEPPLPAGVTTVIPVVSAKAIGRQLTDKVAHRPERLAAIAGLQPGATLEPLHLARLLASPEGALKNIGEAEVVPVINMVDNTARAELARQAALEALRLTQRFDYVVLAAMRAEQPIIEIVRRH